MDTSTLVHRITLQDMHEIGLRQQAVEVITVRQKVLHGVRRIDSIDPAEEKRARRACTKTDARLLVKLR